MRSNQQEESNKKRPLSDENASTTDSNKRPRTEQNNNNEQLQPLMQMPTYVHPYINYNPYVTYVTPPHYMFQGYVNQGYVNQYPITQNEIQPISTPQAKKEESIEVKLNKLAIELYKQAYPNEDMLAHEVEPRFQIGASSRLLAAAKDGSIKAYKKAWDECQKILTNTNFQTLREQAFHIAVLHNHFNIIQFEVEGLKIDVLSDPKSSERINAVEAGHKIHIIVNSESEIYGTKKYTKESGISSAKILFTNSNGECINYTIKSNKNIKLKSEAKSHEEVFLWEILQAYLSPSKTNTILKKSCLMSILAKNDGNTTGLFTDVINLSQTEIRKFIYLSYILSEAHQQLFDYFLKLDSKYISYAYNDFNYFFILAAEQGKLALIEKILENPDCKIPLENRQRALLFALENKNLSSSLMDRINTIAKDTFIKNDNKYYYINPECVLHAIISTRTITVDDITNKESIDILANEKITLLNLIYENDITLYKALYELLLTEKSLHNPCIYTIKKPVLNHFLKKPEINSSFHHLPLPDAGLHMAAQQNQLDLFNEMLSLNNITYKTFREECFPVLKNSKITLSEEIQLLMLVYRLYDSNINNSYKYAIENYPMFIIDRFIEYTSMNSAITEQAKILLSEPLILKCYSYDKWMQLIDKFNVSEQHKTELKEHAHLHLVKPACIALIFSYLSSREAFSDMPPELLILIINLAIKPISIRYNDEKIKTNHPRRYNSFFRAATNQAPTNQASMAGKITLTHTPKL